MTGALERLSRRITVAHPATGSVARAAALPAFATTATSNINGQRRNDVIRVERRTHLPRCH